MRKPTPASAKRRAWKAFARFTRNRDKTCITCSAPTTEAGHFLHTTDKEGTKTLGGNLIWYNEKNVHGQCGTCNRWHSGRRDVYAIKLENKYGTGTIQALYKLYNTPKKYTIEELLEIEKKYNKKYSEMLY